MSGLRAPDNLAERVSNLSIDGRESKPGSSHGGDVVQPLRPVDYVGKRVDLPADAYVLDPDLCRFTRRPGFGNEGAAIKLQLNIFPVTAFKENQTVYQYDVTVAPNPTQSRALITKVWNSDIVQKRLKSFGCKWLYDGHKLAWSSKEISKNEFRITVDLDADKPQKKNRGSYDIIVRQCKTIQMTYLHHYLQGQVGWDNQVLECMNLFDHCLRQTPSETMNLIRRNFYPLNGRCAELDKVVYLRKGYYAAARLSESKRLMINVDTANTAFWQDKTISELVRRMLQNHAREWESVTVEGCIPHLRPTAKIDDKGRKVMSQSPAFALLRRLARLKFTVKHRGNMNDPKIHTIRSFVFNSSYGEVGGHARNVTFEKKLPDGSTKKTTVYDHYRERWGFDLTYWGLPLMETTRGELYPMELCNVANHQRYPFKLDPTQTAAMIKNAVTRPDVRRKQIMEGVRLLNFANDPYLHEFGIKVSDQMVISEARLLPNPEVIFQRGAQINPGVSGRWDLRGKHFLEPNENEIHSWGFVICGDSCTVGEGEVWAHKFVQTYKNHGGNIRKTLYVTHIPFSFGHYGEVTEEAVRRVRNECGRHPQFMFFVVPNRNILVYERIKKSMDCRFFCPSQIIVGQHVSKASPQYMSNVAMKVNAKLGGVTCKSNIRGTKPSDKPIFFQVPTMIIGVDVSHASPGSGAPSMAAMTVSMDKHATRYAAACETNGWRDELLHSTTADDTFTHLLKQWTDRHRVPPQHVYYFRDGVDEGQFESVIKTEVETLRRIIKQKWQKTPKFTVIIATKRHHIRFFPNSADKGSADKNGNPLPGTVVERDATHPFHYDFFLCSHVAIQGTARPVHYQVIHDEINLPPDTLQRMIYHHCYQYARSTTPVSLHPAIYYAHIASNRARGHERTAPADREEPGGEPGHPLAKRPRDIHPDKEALAARQLNPPATLVSMRDPKEKGMEEPMKFLNRVMWFI